jgi:hypothetical protein
MSLSQKQTTSVETTIRESLRRKFQNERWTLKGMLDLEEELKVADEFWDFLGGDGAYQDLLGCFERVGLELRPEIDRYFEKFGKTKI